jgi:hypothetical protein
MGLFNIIRNIFDFTPVRLAIARRYPDANGNYVGELYLLDKSIYGHDVYMMIGASLDNLPLEYKGGKVWRIDTDNDFLAYLQPNTIRVGALNPLDNEYVQHRVARMPYWKREIVVQNRFIETILEGKKC